MTRRPLELQALFKQDFQDGAECRSVGKGWIVETEDAEGNALFGSELKLRLRVNVGGIAFV